jgi:serine/threonine-protein kinase RsbW
MAKSYVALDLDIPSEVGQIEPVIQKVADTCRTLHLSRRQCALNVPVALSEALSNAILRGNREDRSKRVRVRATVDASSLIFEVRDEGPGFNLDASTRDPDTQNALEREDGRGIFLMRQLMDRVEQFNDHGNVVRMTLNMSHNGVDSASSAGAAGSAD